MYMYHNSFYFSHYIFKYQEYLYDVVNAYIVACIVITFLTQSIHVLIFDLCSCYDIIIKVVSKKPLQNDFCGTIKSLFNKSAFYCKNN